MTLSSSGLGANGGIISPCGVRGRLSITEGDTPAGRRLDCLSEVVGVLLPSRGGTPLDTLGRLKACSRRNDAKILCRWMEGGFSRQGETGGKVRLTTDLVYPLLYHISHDLPVPVPMRFAMDERPDPWHSTRPQRTQPNYLRPLFQSYLHNLSKEATKLINKRLYGSPT